MKSRFLYGICRLTVLCFIYGTISLPSSAQLNKYVGTWSTSYQPDENAFVVYMELKIGSPEKEIIYPASLLIKCDSFSAVYNLFLVKKTYNQLGISIYKQPVFESPLSIAPYTRYMNNVLQYNKDDKKGISMSLHRLTPGIFYKEPDIQLADAKLNAIAASLKKFFLEAEVVLKQQSTAPDPGLTKNQNPQYYGKEFGLADTVHLGTDTVHLTIPFHKKNDSDTVSISFNGGIFITEAGIRKKTAVPFLELQKGENVVVLFADNYGASQGNNGSMLLSAGPTKLAIDFKALDPYATFTVARLMYNPAKDSLEKRYESNTFVPPSMTLIPTTTTGDKIATQKLLQRSTTVMGEMETKSALITLALWDDALEDGDSISLNINGKWLIQGFSVKKATQFIKVKLDPGPNTITFIADNLGSVSPNTSVLEIIDGKKRRSFKIETTLATNNAINIFYDFKP